MHAYVFMLYMYGRYTHYPNVSIHLETVSALVDVARVTIENWLNKRLGPVEGCGMHRRVCMYGCNRILLYACVCRV